MRKPRLLYLFQILRQKLVSSPTLRFLLFQEEFPKHQVMESINILPMAFLGVMCLLAGTAGFAVWAQFTIVGFLFYYVGVLLAVLEILHWIYDR